MLSCCRGKNSNRNSRSNNDISPCKTKKKQIEKKEPQHNVATYRYTNKFGKRHFKEEILIELTYNSRKNNSTSLQKKTTCFHRLLRRLLPPGRAHVHRGDRRARAARRTGLALPAHAGAGDRLRQRPEHRGRRRLERHLGHPHRGAKSAK